MRIFWSLTVGSLVLWQLAAWSVFPAGPWIHILLVVGLALGTTGLIFRPIGS
jgi:hypothetical protein